MSERSRRLAGALLLPLALSACATTGNRSGTSGVGARAREERSESSQGPEPAVSAPDGLSSEKPRILVGGPAIEFSGLSTQGETIRLSQYRGKKIVLLQFWGIRCGPCVAEMSFLAGVQRENPETLQIVAINTDRLPSEGVQRSLEAHGVSVAYPVLADPEFAICAGYTQWLIPLTVLVDRAQTVRAIRTGFSESVKAELKGELAVLLSEGP